MALKYSEAIKPITDLKTKSRELVAQAKATGRPILITQRGRVAAVLESIESFEERQERFEAIEGILQALRQAEKGEMKGHEEALKILESFE
jgi:prevent-host-death family protein